MISKLFSGRINRRSFLIGYLASFLPILFYLLFRESINKNIIGQIWFISFVLTDFIEVNVAAKRLHDIGRSGWWAILLVPLSFKPPLNLEPSFISTIHSSLDLLAFGYLLFMPGIKGLNKYGNQPKSKIF